MIQQKLSKRTLIIESAIEIFLEEGYVEASVDRIAQHSGVAKQTVYSTFKNKRLLFEAVIAVLAERSACTNFEEEWLRLPVPEFIEQVAETVLQQIYNTRFPRFLRLITKECRMFPELQSLYGETISKPWLQFVTRYLEQHEELQFSDPYAVAFCLRATLATFAADANFDASGSYYRLHRAPLITGLVNLVMNASKRSQPVNASSSHSSHAASADFEHNTQIKRDVQSNFTGDKRGVILDGALRAFLQSGFTLTSMDDVALAADVSKQTVYGYFTDKKSLFETLSDELMQRLRMDLHAPTDCADLKRFTHDFLNQLSRPPMKEFIRVVLGESQKFQTVSDKYLLFLFGDYRGAVSKILTEKTTPAPADYDPDFGAIVLIGSLANYSILRLIYSTVDYEELSSERMLNAAFLLLGI